MIGLCGVHRSGKTTLAKALAENLGYELVLTNTSQVFKEYRANVRETASVEQHLFIHERILDQLRRDYLSAKSGKPFVTDRTPLDVLMYLYADIHRGVVLSDEQQARFDRLVQRCNDVTRMFLSCVIRVQPGIVIQDDPSKAPPTRAYIEHLNALVAGICANSDLPVVAMSLPRDVVDLAQRVSGCVYGLAKVQSHFVPEMSRVS